MNTSKTITVAVLDETQALIVDRLKSIFGEQVHFVGCDAIASIPENTDVLVTQKLFPPPESLPQVRWVHVLSAGTNQCPAEYAQSTQWTLTHGGGAAVTPIAEWCLAMMLHFGHRIDRILRYQAERKWHTDRVKEMTGTVLRGRTVGIIGYGALGREVGRLCHAFGMNVIASLGRQGRLQANTYRTPGTGDPRGELPTNWFELSDLTEVLEKMDYVVLGLRSTPLTRHLVDRTLLRRFKPSAVLLNPSRGSLIDEAALIEALREHRLAGAALDVFETEPLPANHPLRDEPNVLISPHCSPESAFYREELVQLIAENLRRFIGGVRLLNVVT